MQEKNHKWKLNRADLQYESQLRSRNEKYSSLQLLLTLPLKLKFYTRLVVHHGKPTEEVQQSQNEEEEVVKCCLMGLPQDLPKGEQWIQNKIKVYLTFKNPLVSFSFLSRSSLTSTPFSSLRKTNSYSQEITTTDVVSFEYNVPAAVAKELPAIKKRYGVTFQSEKTKVSRPGNTKKKWCRSREERTTGKMTRTKRESIQRRGLTYI